MLASSPLLSLGPACLMHDLGWTMAAVLTQKEQPRPLSHPTPELAELWPDEEGEGEETDEVRRMAFVC